MREGVLPQVRQTLQIFPFHRSGSMSPYEKIHLWFIELGLKEFQDGYAWE